MDPFSMVIGIVLIVTVGRVLQSRYKGRGPGETAADEAEARRLREEVRFLKDRVAVLERLVTDESGPRALEREIEALRSRDA